MYYCEYRVVFTQGRATVHSPRHELTRSIVSLCIIALSIEM